MFCACEIIVFFVLFCVFTAVHESHFGLVMNEATINGDHWKEGHTVAESHVCGDKVRISSTASLCQY